MPQPPETGWLIKYVHSLRGAKPQTKIEVRPNHNINTHTHTHTLNQVIMWLNYLFNKDDTYYLYIISAAKYNNLSQISVHNLFKAKLF